MEHVEHEEPKEKGQIILTEPTIKARAEHLPERMRDPFLWLSVYLREECSKDLRLLTQRFEEAGVYQDVTTWSRILRGRWNRDAAGQELESPILSEAKFLKAVETLRKWDDGRVRAGKMPFVMTSVAKRIHNYIEFRRAPEVVCKFGVIVGETGTGKSAAFREFRRLNNHHTTALVESPATPSMSQFIKDLARCYGGHPDAGYVRNVQIVAASVDASRIIIVDNVQRLYKPKQGADQPIFHYLQKLQEDSGCTVILSFTPAFELTFTAGANQGFFEQFEGRAGGQRAFLRLPAYPPAKDVVAIAKAFGLEDADEHEEMLCKIVRARGRIRVMCDVLQEARFFAGGKPPTARQIRDAWEKKEKTEE